MPAMRNPSQLAVLLLTSRAAFGQQPSNAEAGGQPPPWALDTSPSATTAQAPPLEAEGQPPAPPGVDASGLTLRPHFVKGELSGAGSVRPFSQGNFVGVATGISGIPSGADTALNTFYLTVEPELDLSWKESEFRFGLGVPLEFMLVDTRALFQKCFEDARATVNASDDIENDPKALAAAQAQATECAESAKENATDELGTFRKTGFDESSDYAKVLRYLTWGHEEGNTYLNVSRLYAQSLGHGTVVRRYNANLDFDTARLGATFDAYHRFIGFESMVNDVVNPDLFGVLGFVRPLEPFSSVLPARSFSVGVSYVGARETPRTLEWEDGFLPPEGVVIGTLFPLSRLDDEYNFVPEQVEDVGFVGFDVETKLIRTDSADLKPYVDVQQMLDHGRGYTLGTLWRFSFGQPAQHAIRMRVEGQTFDADYIPSYFDTFYEVDKYQYRPASYADRPPSDGGDGVVRAPTKLALIDEAAGGPRRVGGYLEFTYSWLGHLQAGFALRGATATGDGALPEFPDYSGCTVGVPEDIDDGQLAPGCTNAQPRIAVDPSTASLLLHFEVPLSRFHLFATYEAFGIGDYVLDPGTAAERRVEGDGLDVFRFDGDNEVLFTGVRAQIWPFMFVQAEARRFFFVQRFTDIDVENISLAQDNNFHSEWTFATSVMLGWDWE